MQNLRRKLEDDISKPIFETIADRVHRHLRDIRSMITDDDIRNVRLKLDITNYYEDFLSDAHLPPA